MKKRSVIISALSALTLLLAGCGSSGSSASDSSTANAAKTADSAAESTAESAAESTAESTADSTAESTAEPAEVKTIKAATMGSPAPYIVVEEDGTVTGYDFKVLNEVFNRLPQYKLETVVTDIGSVFTGVQSGLYDIGVNNFSYNAERAETYLYSFPYDTVSYVFLTKDGSVKSFEDAAGKSFHGTAGISVTNAIEAWNEKNPDKAIKVEYVESGTNIAQEVYDGTVEFTIMDKAMAVEYEKNYSYGLTAVDVPEEEARTIADNSWTYYLFAKENDALRQEINAVLKELREDGTLTKYGNEVFGFDTAPDASQYEKTIN